jgi:two-component system sensor histidine kinase KdpD
MTDVNRNQRPLWQTIVLSLAFLAAVPILATVMIHARSVANATTVGFVYLVVVLLSTVFAGARAAVAVSLLATIFYNYFFFPPFGTFHIEQPDNWIALFAFLLTAIVIGRLTASARENARNARIYQASVKGLRDFGAWLLSVPRDQVTLSDIAREAVRLFSLQYCSIHIYTEGRWHHFCGSAASDTFREVADRLVRAGDHLAGVMELVDEQAFGLRYSQILKQMNPVGLLAVKSEDLPSRAIDAVASMTGILLTEMLAAGVFDARRTPGEWAPDRTFEETPCRT